MCAVGDEDCPGSMCDEVTRCDLTHFARADEVNVLALQRPKYLLRQVDRKQTPRIQPNSLPTFPFATRLATAKERESRASMCELSAPTLRATA